MSLEFSTMRSSLMILLLVASGLGNPIPSSPSSIKATSAIDTFENVGFVVHNIR